MAKVLSTEKIVVLYLQGDIAWRVGACVCMTSPESRSALTVGCHPPGIDTVKERGDMTS
jgi:hypothetical protein